MPVAIPVPKAEAVSEQVPVNAGPKKVRTVAKTGADNPNNVPYGCYDYVSVEDFTPLSNDNWYGSDYVNSVETEDWTAKLSVTFNVIEGWGESITLDVLIQVTSYDLNSFRVRFNPDGPIPEYTSGPILKKQLDYIREQEEENDPCFDTSDPGNALIFVTKDLRIYVNNNAAIVVTRKRDNEIIYQDDEMYGKSRGLMFVNRQYGTALASVRRNRKDDPIVDEAFYGAGEVVAENIGGDYFLERTGLAMTNYNYDNLNYNQPGVVPPEVTNGSPNYYIPMYYAAPWVIVHGYRGASKGYSYGWFFDNISQSYMNTGDTQFNGQPDKAFMGSQCGPFDQHFIYGDGDGIEDVVKAFSYFQGKEHEGQQLNKRAVMPPKYVLGFFQGVFGVRGVLPSSVDCTEENNFIVWESIVDGYQSANIPLEGLAVDVDVQDKLKVFTTQGPFWTAGYVGEAGDECNQSVFEWAHDRGLVTQTNITCFVRADNDEKYSVYDDMVDAKVYTRGDALDGKPFAPHTVGPSDAFVGKLNYGEGNECKAVFPDWGRADTASWWGANYAKLFKLGLDFVWQDMTVPAMAPHIRGKSLDEEVDWKYLDNVPKTGEFNWKSYHPQVLVADMRKDNGDREPFMSQHNMHAYTLCKATRDEGIVKQADSLSKFKRSYIISRGGYIGNQHFGGVWCGDNSSTEDYLQTMLTTTINMNMSCCPIVGSDIGGFTESDGTNPCPEPLMNRWVQAGCLMPWFRDHYSRWVEDKPSGKMYQELYRFEAVDSMRKAVELRYRWQEVLYTAMYQNVTTGTPPIKALSMWRNDPNLILFQKDQFMLGGHDGFQILVAPIVHVDKNARDVYLPDDANWVQYGMNGDKHPVGPFYVGGMSIKNYYVQEDEMIIFVQEGAILPTRYTEKQDRNKSMNTYTEADPLVFEVFGFTDGCKGMMYLDDGGKTTEAEDSGKFSVVTLEGSVKDTAGTLKIKAEQNKFPNNAPFYIRVRNAGTVYNVMVGKKKATSVFVNDRYSFFAKGENSYWVDVTTNSVWVKVPASALVEEETTITMTCSDSIFIK